MKHKRGSSWYNSLTTFMKRKFVFDKLLVRRILKCTVNSTLAFTLCLIPQVRSRIGAEPAMLPLISVMAHPGRRLSTHVQCAFYIIIGLLLGLGYALLGRIIAQRCLGSSWGSFSDEEHRMYNYDNLQAALAILAVFEILMLFFHGWMRAINHFYFYIVFPLFLVVHFAFLAPLSQSSRSIAEAFSIPFYIGIPMAIFFNLAIYPEFGSTYLGATTIGTMNDIHHFLNNAVNFFISIDNKNLSESRYEALPCTLARLLSIKNAINKRVTNCEQVLEECMYELSYSYVSPLELKNVIGRFRGLSMYVSGLANACQLEFMLLCRVNKKSENDTLNVGADREIIHADSKKLLKILHEMKGPIFELHKTINECLYISKIVLADSYDVDFQKVRIPSVFKETDTNIPVFKGNQVPSDLDFHETLENLQQALAHFDLKFREELHTVELDLLNPGDEMFLLSSFLVNLKEFTHCTIEIMQEAERIHGCRKEREAKGWIHGKSVWFLALHNFENFLKWIDWSKSTHLATESEALQGRANNPPGTNGETAMTRPFFHEDQLLAHKSASLASASDREPALPIPNSIASVADSTARGGSKNASVLVFSYATACKFIQKLMISTELFFKKHRECFRFAIQVTIALMAASFPMFLPERRDWYVKLRGSWVGFVCILSLEPNVGGTFWVFFLRGVGVIAGAAWAYVSYLIGDYTSSDVLLVIVTIIGAVPGFYYLLASPYIKAAIIQIISIYVVILATTIKSRIPGTIHSNFAKRCLAVAYGGGIALVVQTTVFPIKARDQLNGELSFVTGCLAEMQSTYATHLEGGKSRIKLPTERFQRFNILSANAKAALDHADAYKALARKEPRLKGDYSKLEKVFTQIIFILRQIIDRMDNIVILRKQYGSVVLEELNQIVYPYRRNVIASTVCTIRALQEAITNKTPLPQFFPSARIHHRRLINKVRSCLTEQYKHENTLYNRRTNGTTSNQEKTTETSDEISVNPNHDTGSLSSTEEGIIFVASKELNMRATDSPSITQPPHDYILREEYLGWNATSAAVEEVIEYIEELVQLVKLLVGVTEFKYGFLSRSLFSDWAAEAVTGMEELIKNQTTQRNHAEIAPQLSTGTHQTNADDRFSNHESSLASDEEDTAEIPMPLHTQHTVPLSNLVRLASIDQARHRPGRHRLRAHSIDGGESILLYATRTLGEVDSSAGEISSNEDELPLVLRRIVSKNR